MTTKQDRLNNIKSALDWHCQTNFNKDYHNKVNKLIKELGKNKCFSMDTGKEDGWISGILYVVGEDSDLFNKYNFTYDKGYYTKTDLAKGCGVSILTMKSRAQKIRESIPNNLSFEADLKNFKNTSEDSIFNDEITKNLNIIQKELSRILKSDEFMFRNEEFDEKYKEYQAKAISSCDYKEAVKYMKKAIVEAKKKIIPSLFKDLKGKLWLEHDARPYMNLRKELADLYYIGEEYDKSIKELWELIDLNTGDNQGNRFDLAVQLLRMRRFKDFEKLVNMFEDDTSTFMVYSKALYSYKKEDVLGAKRFIKEAFETNEYVPQIFMGLAEPKRMEGMCYTVGGQDEATLYVTSSVDTWENYDEALFWLVDEYYTYKDKKGEYISINKDTVKKFMEDKYFQDFF